MIRKENNIEHLSQKENPLITVITVVYNGFQVLEKTICSVINQTFDNFEYIIIDGASNDGTLDIIKQYENDIDYWQSEKDSGIYDAMNKGIQLANSEYCIFLNSGDYFINNNVLEAASKYLTGIDIISGKEVLSNHSVISGPNKDDLNIFTYMNSYIPHESTFIKTKLLKTELYNINYKIISDYVFFFRVLFFQDVSYSTIPEKITYFSLDGISANNRVLANKELTDFYNNNLPKYIVDLYYKHGGILGCLEIKNYKILLLVFRICRKIKRLINQKLNYYL